MASSTLTRHPMKLAYLPFILRFTKVLTWVFIVMAGVLTLALCSKLADVATELEVRLVLETTRPNLFGAWHDADAGFRDGEKGRAREERGPLLALPATTSFALVADPHAALLRYREPSAGKRMLLLVLGALDDSLSVAGLFFLGYGSWLLLKLLQDVTPATPFTQANAQRLRKLTLLVFGLHLWHYVAYQLIWVLVPDYRAAALAQPLSHYVRLNTDDLLPGVAVGFILLIIAAVYQRGVELSREAELVI
ncbi:MAG: DUF2975 domain-containing protein [Janthinobacterium lividum]